MYKTLQAVSGRNIRFILLGLALVLTLLCVGQSVLFLQPDSFETGVFRIETVKRLGTAIGSGFKVADPGYVITNHHVIEDGKKIYVVVPEDGQGKRLAARLVWFNADKDLAILKTGKPLPGDAVTLAEIDRAELSKTQEVTAVGYPGIGDTLGILLASSELDRENRQEIYLDATVTRGTIQRLVPSAQRLTIQHNANINGGNSGGPLFDACNRVIGVNTLGATTHFSVRDINKARKRGGTVQVENPGDLEFSVHVKEVISALNEKGVPYAGHGGACHAGLDDTEIAIIGSTGVLALASALFGLVLVFRPSLLGSGMGQVSMPSDTEYVDLEAESDLSASTKLYGYGNPVVSESIIRLVAKEDGQTIDLTSPFSENQRAITIGRQAGLTDVVINNRSVSRHHAQLSMSPDGFEICDLGSTNGTLLNNVRLAPNVNKPLFSGDIITFGKMECMFELKEYGDRQGQGAGTVSRTEQGWLLSGFDQKGHAIQYHLAGSSDHIEQHGFSSLCVIGRDTNCDLVLEDDAISRKHAVIGLDAVGVLCLKDLGSANGSYVDGHRIGDVPYNIEKANTLEFGATSLTISKR
ncbi:FHA domain-containing protein [uncultured Cohaesibacter sp.]|uniref:FHA domain-containing protein n=1 Tax=uncultured Cohaesibacter sp. TaxID=1002546 RepID=UPI002AA8DB4C|nr:FHA domain-containing protein [uncultured Cohaesibacter sp.]